VAIYGSRPDGHAKVLVDLLEQCPSWAVAGLIDDFEENRSHEIRGISVLAGCSELHVLRAAGIEGVLLGFGQACGRLEAMARVERAGLALPTLLHPTALLSPSAVVGDGSQILAGAYVGPDASLGAATLLNTRAIVEHDAALGAGSVVSPGAIVLGRARIGHTVFIGAGAVVLPDVVIGDYAVVGAGAVVTDDVPPAARVVGAPARPMKADAERAVAQ
jgi:sugar O-acyltransferase (sialic acid O-acetyltransferase NeuD family)